VLITKHFVFLHLQKTGGMFIKDVCERHLPADWEIRQGPRPHGTYRQMPAELKQLPVFALVRNPWDWYVSWYHFARALARSPEGEQHMSRDSVMVWVNGSGEYNFKRATRIACTGVPDLPDPPAWMQKLQDSGVDLYSRWYWNCMGYAAEANNVDVGRIENLREDFISFLNRHDVPVDDGFVHRVRTEPRKNTSSHGPFQGYYDDDLRELVEHKARYLIDRYGYSF
jgi:hypothetical protein